MQTVATPARAQPAISRSEAAEARLEGLLRDYPQQRSARRAVEVVRHIEALLADPDFQGDRCAYARLVRTWRWLADGGAAAEAPRSS